MQKQFHLEQHSIGLVEYRRKVAQALRDVLSEYRMSVQELADIVGRLVDSGGNRITVSNLHDVLSAARIIERPEFFYMLLYAVFDREEFDPRKIPDRAQSIGVDQTHVLRPRAWETRMIGEWRGIHAEPVAKMRRLLMRIKQQENRSHRRHPQRGRTYEEWARMRAKMLRDWRYANRRQFPTFSSLEQELAIEHHQMEGIIRFDRPNILLDLVIYAKIWYLTGLQGFNPAEILELDSASGQRTKRKWVQKSWDEWVRRQPRRPNSPSIEVGYNPFVTVSTPEKDKPKSAQVAAASQEPVLIEEPDIVDVELSLEEQSVQFGSVSDLLRRFSILLAAAELTLTELQECGVVDLSERIREIMKAI